MTGDSAEVTGTVSGGTGAFQTTWTVGTLVGRAEGNSSWRATIGPLSVGSNLIVFSAQDSAGAKAVQAIVVQRAGSCCTGASRPRRHLRRGCCPAPSSSTERVTGSRRR